jgi:DNA-binding MarR family transcriptional regulator
VESYTPPDGAFGRQCADALSQLFMHVRAHFESSFADLGLPLPCGKALRVIESSMSMKELASHLHCDGSFVTAIADALEERGLARRETDPNDRRIKKLVLTAKGEEMRVRVHEVFDNVPGTRLLAPDEREAFLHMLHKMVGGESQEVADLPATRPA